MSGGAPEYYFRVRENGAFVFRVLPEDRSRRVEMEQIAVVNVKNGEIRANGDRTLGDAEFAAIEAWLDERREVLARRDVDDVARLVDQLNLVTVWALQRATPEDLARVDDALLLAMHDLRAVLVRKKADRLGSGD